MSMANFNHTDTNPVLDTNLHVFKSLGPNSLLLQGFDYEAAKERFDAAQERRRARRAQAASNNINNNIGSNSRSAACANVNNNSGAAPSGITSTQANDYALFDPGLVNNIVRYVDPKNDDGSWSLLRPVNNGPGNPNGSFHRPTNQSQSKPLTPSASGIDKEDHRQEIDDFFAMRGQAWNVDSLDTFASSWEAPDRSKSAEQGQVDVDMTPKAWLDFVSLDDSVWNTYVAIAS